VCPHLGCDRLLSAQVIACDEHSGAVATTEANAAGARSTKCRGLEQSPRRAVRPASSTWERTWVPPPLEDPAFSAVVVAWLSAAGVPPDLGRYRGDGG
jgi:hypothetical protein